MSARTPAKPHGRIDAGDEQHAAHNDQAHGPAHAEPSHSTFKGYVIGFVLSVILTAIPFWLVMNKTIASSTTTAIVILSLAAVQIVVHMIYFLHMNTRSEGGWSLLALLFTIMLVVITLSGSVWVMYHLNENMMPPSLHDMRNMP